LTCFEKSVNQQFLTNSFSLHLVSNYVLYVMLTVLQSRPQLHLSACKQAMSSNVGTSQLCQPYTITVRSQRILFSVCLITESLVRRRSVEAECRGHQSRGSVISDYAPA